MRDQTEAIRTELRRYVEEEIPRTEIMIGGRMWQARAMGRIALLVVDYLEAMALPRVDVADE